MTVSKASTDNVVIPSFDQNPVPILERWKKFKEKD